MEKVSRRISVQENEFLKGLRKTSLSPSNVLGLAILYLRSNGLEVVPGFSLLDSQLQELESLYLKLCKINFAEVEKK